MTNSRAELRELPVQARGRNTLHSIVFHLAGSGTAVERLIEIPLGRVVRRLMSMALAGTAVACVPAIVPSDTSAFVWVALMDLDAPTRVWIEEGEDLDPVTVFVAKADLDVPPVGGAGSEELLVRYEGEGDCGPGCGQLKAFRDDGQGRRLILSEYGRSLRRGPGAHNGLAEILVDGTPFRFDGDDYRPAWLVGPM